mmetsp:Transcript_10762/g.26669  ORF Transcript_10762/g.26669 Transcript_10762/m.26669 type:complete len:334 (-) Transcript_10762:338-1339(-)
MRAGVTVPEVSVFMASKTMPVVEFMTTDEMRPWVCPLMALESPLRSLAFWLSSLTSFFCTLILPPAAICPSDPMPTLTSVPPNTSSSWTPNWTRLACFIISLMAYFSLIALALFPPLFFFWLMSGAGSALAFFWGGGSIALASASSIWRLKEMPTSPAGHSLAASTLAVKAHFADTSLAAFFWLSGGCPTTMGDWLMTPPRTPSAAVDMPFCTLRLDPIIWMLQAGMRDSSCSPPAMAIMSAATLGPTTTERLGARMFMRVSTNSRIVVLMSSISKTDPHARITLSSTSSARGLPLVVVAVTVTTMMVALGRMPPRSTAVMSASLPILCTVLT